MQSEPQWARTHATTSDTLSHRSFATKLAPFSVSSRLYLVRVRVRVSGFGLAGSGSGSGSGSGQG